MQERKTQRQTQREAQSKDHPLKGTLDDISVSSPERSQDDASVCPPEEGMQSVAKDSDSMNESNMDITTYRGDVDDSDIESTCSTPEPADQELIQDEDVAEDPDGTAESAQSEPVGPDSVSEDEATPSLAPLGSSKPGGAGKKTVHRQLPEWILKPNLVENDIKQYSR